VTLAALPEGCSTPGKIISAELPQPRRGQALKSLLDEATIENLLSIDHGGNNHAYWVSNFEMYLRWLANDRKKIHGDITFRTHR
jgi:hypothetical protein